MLIGYARVSTADQNPDHQTDALARAGVDPANIYLDHASGAKASRPELDKALASANRAGDQLVITRLDRLGRSALHLVTLGAALRERGVGLRVLEQGIDTTTAEGRAMFGMLSVLAELQRELIVANTRDGLASARARGRTGGRRPKLTPPSGPPRPTALRRRHPHRPTHRRPAPSPSLHDLRTPQQGKHRATTRRKHPQPRVTALARAPAARRDRPLRAISISTVPRGPHPAIATTGLAPTAVPMVPKAEEERDTH
ncbi:recombinase family protein [Rothia sp. P100]|nr:recombinase family protein [Rothia sp. P100]MCM3510632.1 recombinase family protein [Rothia sp. P100]